MPEVDEYGIPIKKAAQTDVDEYGIPIKKKAISAPALPTGFPTLKSGYDFSQTLPNTDPGFRAAQTAPTAKVAPAEFDSGQSMPAQTGAGAMGQEMFRAVGRGLTEAIPSTLESIAVGAKAVDAMLPEGLQSYSGAATEDLATWRLGRTLRSDLAKVFPRNPMLQDSFMVQTAEGLGQVGAMILSRSPIRAGAMGIAQGGSMEYREALDFYKDVNRLEKEEFVKKYSKDKDAGEVADNYSRLKKKKLDPDEEAFENWMYGSAIGATEMLPILKFLKRADDASGGTIKKTILKKGIEVGKQGIDEALQEGVATWLSNLQARETYDATRDLLQGVGESAKVGGAVGSILQLLMGINTRRMQAETDPAERAILRANEAQLRRVATTLDTKAAEPSEELVQTEEQIAKLQDDLANPAVPAEVKTQVQKEVDRLDKVLEKQEAIDVGDQFDQDVQVGVAADITELETALADPTISEDVKAIMAKTLALKQKLLPAQETITETETIKEEPSDAIPLETANEIPLQPAPGDSGAMAEGTPGPESQIITEESISETIPESQAEEKVNLPVLVDKLDNQENYTVADLADDVEGLLETHPELEEAVAKYRQEQQDDLELAGRGDMDTAGMEFEQAVRAVIAPVKETKSKPKAAKAIDLSGDTREQLLEKLATSKDDAELKAVQAELKKRPEPVAETTTTGLSPNDQVSFTDHMGQPETGVILERKADGDYVVLKSNGVKNNIPAAKLTRVETASTETPTSPLTKAENDLASLKQSKDKAKKYEASIKRLSEAKSAKSITENEFTAMKDRFDDVMAEGVSGLQSAKNKLAEARAALDSSNKNLGIANDPELKAKALFEYHKALVITAKEYIKKGVKDAQAFATAIGEQLTQAVRDAWSEANGGNKKTYDDFLENQPQPQDRKKNLTTERIQVQRSKPTGAAKKLNNIIADLAQALKATVIYAKSRRRNAAGSYNPTNALINIRNAGDIDTAAHEIGHLLDDTFDLLASKPATVDAQLKWFAERGGSNPPAGMKGQAAKTYLEREGLAEFIRAYVANPAEAKTTAPELFAYFESALNKETLSAIKDFSKDYINFANSPAGDQIMANILETPALKEKQSAVDWLMDRSNNKDNFSIGWYDDVKSHVADSLHAAKKAFNYAKNLKGLGELLPEKNFEVLARIFAGVNGKVDRIFKSGMIDSKNSFLKDKGKNMTVSWLFEPLDTTSKETLDQESKDVIQYMVAQRTVEYAKKFNRTDGLSGIGGGVKTDLSVATEYLEDFKKMKGENPGKAERIEEAARRYRQYADSGLRYALDKGRLSQEQYAAIKDGNEYYVSLARAQEVAPEQEPLSFVSSFSRGGLGSVKEVLKKAKGGTGLIQNPYISLLKNTTDLINESDRNEVLQNFVEVLTESRNMGEGEVKALGQIGRQVQQGEKNTKTVYVEGSPQKWQFQEDVYKALTGMESESSSGIIPRIAQWPGKMLRWTVTHFPAFAVKNLIRDTQQRLIISRSNGGFRQLIHSLPDRELFDLYGGSQAGWHLTSREAYYDRMAKATKELTDNGGLVLDPRKLGDLGKGYVKFLGKSENVNRIAEFKSAFKQAKKEGLDDYNASLYAAYQGRDLLDFAVAGHTIRGINKYVPFTNAAVQGLRRTMIGIKEKPLVFTARIALYSVVPQILVHALNIYNGDEEEYEQLPFYQRDLFYNFKTPLTGDKWVSIPKPFDLGLVSSGVDRAISYGRGHKDAFGKFGRSMYSVLSPVDESTLMPGIKPILEILANHDFYRDQGIVPEWEENLMLSKRKGTRYASNLGKKLSEAFGLVGTEVDPRYIDHAVKGFASYYGDFGMRLSNIGSETGKKLGIEQTGVVRERPIANSKDVLETYDLAEKLGEQNSKDVRKLRDAIGTFYDLKTEKERSLQADVIHALAKKEREKLEKEYEKALTVAD